MPTTGSQHATRESLLRRWSFDRLGLADDADQATIRRQLLEKLIEQDLVPTEQDRLAVRVLAGLSPGDPSHYRPADWEIEARLGEKVESFATQYFTLDVQGRQELWESLQAESVGYPAIHMRLRELEPGLAINRASLTSTSADVREMAEGILRRFPLPAGERSAARRRDLAERQAKIRLWRRVARQLVRDFPQIAALDRDYIRGFASQRVQRALVKGLPAGWRGNKTRLAGIGLAIGLVTFVGFILIKAGLSNRRTFRELRLSRENPFIKLNKNFRQGALADEPHPAKKAVQDGLKKIMVEAADREKEDSRKRLSADFAKEFIQRTQKKFEADRQMTLAESTAKDMRDVVTARTFYLKAGQLYREVYDSDPRDFAALRKSLECVAHATAKMSPDAPEREKLLLTAITSAKLQVARPEVLPEDYRQLSDLLDLLAQTRKSQKLPRSAWLLMRESVAALASARTPAGDSAVQEILDTRWIEIDALTPERSSETSLGIASERRKVWAGNAIRLQRLAYEFTRRSESLQKAATTEMAGRKESDAWLAQALVALQDAVAAGATNLEVVDQSAEWSALRNSPAYQAWRRSLPSGKPPEKKS
jgi:hypothetical protein